MTSLCKERYIVNQVLENLFTAISEHRWKDALTLLPTVVAFAKFRISPYFVWKVMHITMANAHIPMGIHINILNIVLKSSIKKHEAVLDMLAFNFGKFDDNDMETLSEATQEVRKGRQGKQEFKGQSLRDICKAYKALHYYLKWKKMAFPFLNKSWLNDTMHPEFEQKQKETNALGKKAHIMLNQAYLAFQCSEQKDKSAILEETDSECREDTEMMCEWLLGPLLDIEHQLKINEDFARKRSFVRRFHGLDLIEDYAKNHSTHLPALRTYYYYLTKYHLDEKMLIKDILQKIVDLSPECSLMLQYVYNNLSEQIGDGADRRSRNSTNCLLANKDIDVLLKCLRLLSNFIEYPMWRKDVRAWKALTDILKFFHLSWVSCWSCDNCTFSREKIAEFSDTLDSWPEFIWHDFYLDSLSEVEAEVIVYSGYSSFIMGFSDNIAKQSLYCLEQLKCSTEAMKLLALMKPKGDFTKDLLLYLFKQRKKRSFISIHKKKSKLPIKRFSVIKKNIKFGDDIESLNAVINDDEDILYDDSQSLSGITKQDVTNEVESTNFSSSKNEERMNLNSETSVQAHESLKNKKILFGKKNKSSIDDNTSQYNASENKSMDEVPNLNLVTLEEVTSCGKISFGKKKTIRNDFDASDNAFNSRNRVSPSSSSENSDKKIRVMERLGLTTTSLYKTSCDESRIIKFGKRSLNKPDSSSPATLKKDVIRKDSVRSIDSSTSFCFGEKMKTPTDSTISLSTVKENKESAKPQIDCSKSEKIRFGKRKAMDIEQSPSRKKKKLDLSRGERSF